MPVKEIKQLNVLPEPLKVTSSFNDFKKSKKGSEEDAVFHQGTGGIAAQAEGWKTDHR